METTDYNWSDFDDASNTDLSVFWDSSKNYYQNCESLLPRVLYHSEIYTLKSVLSAFICCHSVAMNFAPILFLSGTSGSGKSHLTNFIALMRSKPILGGSSTFASIRNQLNRDRWIYLAQSRIDTSRANEKESMLLWSDIKASNLADPKLYGLLRNGTSRKEDKLTIAGEAGENLEFYVFCPKVVSSIEDFYGLASFTELKRRLLLVRSEKLDMKATSAANFVDNSFPDDMTFKEQSNLFFHFWSATRLNNLAKLKKGGDVKRKIRQWDSDNQNAYYDLICQHVVMSDSPVKDVIAIWENYLRLQKTWMSHQSLSIDIVVKSFVSPLEAQFKACAMPIIEINHNDIHNRVQALKFGRSVDQIPSIMNVLGYSHRLESQNLVWYKEL